MLLLVTADIVTPGNLWKGACAVIHMENAGWGCSLPGPGQVYHAATQASGCGLCTWRHHQNPLWGWEAAFQCRMDLGHFHRSSRHNTGVNPGWHANPPQRTHNHTARYIKSHPFTCATFLDYEVKPCQIHEEHETCNPENVRLLSLESCLLPSEVCPLNSDTFSNSRLYTNKLVFRDEGYW